MFDLGSLTVVIVDEDEMVREGIQLLLERIGVQVLGHAADGNSAILEVERLQPQIVLLEIIIPLLNGIEVARCIHKRYPKIGIVMLTGCRQHDQVIRSLIAGARGFVSKRADVTELYLAVRAVSQEKSFISPSVLNEVIVAFVKHDSKSDLEFERLTPRQTQVLQLVANGQTNKDVANTLNLSVKAVEKHRTGLMNRLNVHNTAGLVLYALRSGLVKSD